MYIFTVHKLLVWCSPICLLLLLFPLPEETDQKICTLLRLMSKNILSMFSSRAFWFQVLHLFKSLTYFEFIFVYGVRKWPSFILLYVAVQFSQTPFIEEADFFPWHILASFVIDWHIIFSLLLSSLFYSLIYVCLFLMPIPYYYDYYSFVIQFEIREHDISSFVLL